MACEIISAEGAVFVLWGRPTHDDLERVLSRIELGAAAAGHPIVFITRVPEGAPAPDAAVRARLNQLMPEMIRLCSSYHVLLEGDGFMSAIKRSILAGLFQVGFRKGTFFVHDGQHDVLEKLKGEPRRSAQAMLALASAEGLLDAGPPLESSAAQ